MIKYNNDSVNGNNVIFDIKYDILLKVVIVGNEGVGKSSILLRYVDNIFYDQLISTIGVDFRIKTISCKSKLVKLQLWDTAGQERFRTITSSYYRGAKIILFTYDVSNRESFNQIKGWMENINRYKDINDNWLLVLIGNKSDSTNKCVSTEEGFNLANDNNMMFFEISVKNDKDGFKTSSMFSNIVNQYFDTCYKENSIIYDRNTNNISVNNNNNTKDKNFKCSC